MSRIVCNSGPLIALGVLDRLDLLKFLFQEVLVPEIVLREVEAGGKTLAGLQNIRQATWIRVEPLKEKCDELLGALLDKGEAAVICLAREQKAMLVLIDERKARKVARDVYGLQTIGTARILVEAKKRNLLPNVAAEFQKLQQHGYWIQTSIVETALREAGEL